MVAVYIYFTQKVTDWRNQLRAEMNDLDTQTVARSVDSLLNYETVISTPRRVAPRPIVWLQANGRPQ